MLARPASLRADLDEMLFKMQGEKKKPASNDDQIDPQDEKFLAKIVKQLRKSSLDDLQMLANPENDLLVDCLINQSPTVSRLAGSNHNLIPQTFKVASFIYLSTFALMAPPPSLNLLEPT